VRVLLDACVLFPTVLREVLLGAAAAGGYTPLWSPRILEEWARVAARIGPEAEQVARAEIALVGEAWPAAEVAPDPALAERLHLPDPGDRHVLAAAIAGGADGLVTVNRADFPRHALTPHGIAAWEPDGFLLRLHRGGPGLAPVAAAVQARAERAAGRALPLRPLLKRARLPRLGKALTGAPDAQAPPACPVTAGRGGA
jgi:predicted nucleic acid-binding protein